MSAALRPSRSHRATAILVIASWAGVAVCAGAFGWHYSRTTGLVSGDDVLPLVTLGIGASAVLVVLGTRVGAYVLGAGSLPRSLLMQISEPDFLPQHWRLVTIVASPSPGRSRSIVAATVAGWFTGLVLGLVYGAVVSAVATGNLATGQQRAVAWLTLVFACAWVAFATCRMLRRPVATED